MARSIADLSLSFGLVSIPVKVFPATQASGGVHFNLLHKTCGSRLKQQYKCIKEDVIVERADMVKGYEFAKDQYVVFTPEELKALEEKGTHTVEIVAFVPAASIDPIYYDKAYYLAPDKRGARPYTLLLEGMRETNRCALARWAWKGKQYTTQVRPGADGLILQQLLYADEVRSMKELDIETADIKKPELDLAVQLINQIAADEYDPKAYQDDVKNRIESAVEQKVAGQQITVSEEPEHDGGGGKVIDLMEALRASLAKKEKAPAKPTAETATATEAKTRKPAQRTRQAAAPAATGRAKAKK
ncbi:MAG: Ku protein [Burkholderiales bacterium]|nr:Ku protein [Burkholderiales bacterium]